MRWRRSCNGKSRIRRVSWDRGTHIPETTSKNFNNASVTCNRCVYLPAVYTPTCNVIASNTKIHHCVAIVWCRYYPTRVRSTPHLTQEHSRGPKLRIQVPRQASSDEKNASHLKPKCLKHLFIILSLSDSISWRWSNELCLLYSTSSFLQCCALFFSNSPFFVLFLTRFLRRLISIFYLCSVYCCCCT